MFTFDISGAQIDGARDYQEDAFLITHLGDSDAESGSLVIVADGMGGHAAGNVASNMAVQTFNKHITSNFPDENLPAQLNEAVVQANNSITETVRETAALKGMGCTLVAIVLEENHLRWVSVGDSHLYLCRDNEIKKLNADHSYGGFLDRMAAEGTPVDPEAGFSRNMLMSALTGDEIADIDCPSNPFDLMVGDRIIVASDGLDTLSNGKILSFSEEAESAKECVEALLGAVEEAKMPRQDNTTVVVVGISGKSEKAAAASAAPAAESAPEPAPNEARSDAPEAIDPASRTGQFIIEEDEPSRRGLIIGVLAVLILALGGGGAYWYLQNQASEDDGLIAFDGPDTGPIEDPMDEPIEDEEPDIGDDESVSLDDVLAAGDDDEGDTTDSTSTDETPDSAPSVAAGTSFSDTMKSGGQGPTMMTVPGGEFVMGSSSNSAEFDERPSRKITVAPFAMSIHEITIAEYTRFARAAGRIVHKKNTAEPQKFPVLFVSWNDAVAYAQWLSTQTGHKYRIPTEAEWEYAARAGTSTAYWWGRYLGSDNAHCFACETGLDPRQPTRIGRFTANAFGIKDTAGNVQEWVYDCYHKNYEGAPVNGGVFDGGDCSVRVVRGGAYSSGPKALRSAARDKFRFDAGNDSIGIRVVRDLP